MCALSEECVLHVTSVCCVWRVCIPCRKCIFSVKSVVACGERVNCMNIGCVAYEECVLCGKGVYFMSTLNVARDEFLLNLTSLWCMWRVCVACGSSEYCMYRVCIAC